MIPFLLIFLGMVDFPPAACRAFLMITLYLISPWVGREPDPLNIVGVSGILLLLWNPLNCRDPGFILSYTAVISLVGWGREMSVFFTDWMERIKEKHGRDTKLSLQLDLSVKYFFSPVLYSSAVWLGTAPLTLYYFKLFSMISVISNLLSASLMSLIMLCSFMAILLGSFWELAAEAYLHMASFCLDILIFIFRELEKIPFSFIEISQCSLKEVLLEYVVLGISYGVIRVFLIKSRETGY